MQEFHKGSSPLAVSAREGSEGRAECGSRCPGKAGMAETNTMPD